MPRQIQLRNVRVNNLQEVDLDIPHGQWLALCGLSGSGKSSLAFDTLYAEGQRRYLECLAPQTRQFIHQLDKPDADRIDGIPPAIAVKAFRGKVGRRSTVGTATEITEYFRLMYANVSIVVCPQCRTVVTRENAQTVAGWLHGLSEGTRYQIVFRANPDEDFGTALLGARQNGFTRAIVGETVLDLARPESSSLAPGSSMEEMVRIVVDRLKTGVADLGRIRESLELAFQYGNGQCEILLDGESVDSSYPAGVEVKVDGRNWNANLFSRALQCTTCAREFPDPEPRRFSFGNSLGACEACAGNGFLDAGEFEPCPECGGGRLNQEALSFRMGGLNLAELGRLTVDELIPFLETIPLSSEEQRISRELMTQIRARLEYLQSVGLAYLTLDRSLRTLSAGEAQRVSLTACLSSTLVNMLYVLDEPSIGLHSHDADQLVSAIGMLQERGNTVVVVDHEPRVIQAAERIVEIGPGAGASGGEVVFDGTIEQMLEPEASLTGDFLAGRRGILCGADHRRSPRGRIKLTGAQGHNLKNIDVEFPLGCLCVVTGVSGAGKSSLVQQTLYGAICRRKEKSCDPPLEFSDLFGDQQFDDVVLIDQSPIGRTPRSNPVTYVKAFDDLRRTFAETIDAKTHNLKVGHFSFNVAGGRCDKCEGAGQISIDMQFMSDIYMICDQCGGTRYRDEVLAVRYRGKSIADVLNLTVREAFTFFRGQPKVQSKLKSLIDVGLDYIRLGQPATTLSSGEAQRLKLGHYLNASKTRRALFIMDEPTMGLHMQDVTRLLECFDALLSVGHSLIIVEHNLQLIKNADWIIDLGPGPAEAGGQIVATGPPEKVAENEDSLTGRYLKAELGKLEY